jgi:hypothetical protein
MKPQSHSHLIIGSSEHTFKRVSLRRSQVIRVKEAAWTLGVAPNSTGAAESAGKKLRQGSSQSSVARDVRDTSASDGAVVSISECG